MTANKEKEERVKLIITQPRRVAAIQMAKRVAYEMNCRLGEEVGYTIRFEDKSSESTLIKYVTDGILVRECLTDKMLSKYNVIILDEAHERSLYTDILFALCKQAVLNRKGSLRLIITSATLDTKQFSEFYNNCKVFAVQGRCYPVDKVYFNCRMEKRVETSVKLAIRIHLHENPGHILVFLTGFEECEQACKMCYAKLEELSKKGKTVSPIIIMPLYGAQNTDEQAQIFEKAPDNCRKLIFSTNIAETSLTVEGIGYVIDCGYVKQKVYNARTSMDTLSVIPISKVQAVQRAGRAGRTGPGKCIRLYTEQFFDTQMSKITVPEIMRVNLANTILTLKSMGINDVLDFEFMDKPEIDSILEALKILYFLQAIDENGKITDLGFEMSKFPLDSNYTRALIASKFYNINDEMTILVSLISSENIWSNVNKYDEERRSYFEQKKGEFIDKYSDHMSLLNIYKEWEYNNFSEDWCKSNFVQIRALKSARNIKSQIKDYLNKVNFKICEKYFNLKNISNLIEELNYDNESDDYQKTNILLRMTLCQGFYMNAARKIPNVHDNSYLKISDGSIVTLDSHSSISLKGLKPTLVLYTELGGSTSKAVMKQASEIELKWINDLLYLIKNIDVTKLRGRKSSPDKNTNEDLYENMDLRDIYNLSKIVNRSNSNNNNNNNNQNCNKYNVKLELQEESKIFKEDLDLEQEEVKEELKKKALMARERFLQRKTNRPNN